MGSVQDWVQCPKCKEEGTYGRDYYYKTGEEYCTCMYCGYTRNVTLQKDENKNLIRRMAKKCDLREGNIFYAETKKDDKGHLFFVRSIPVEPTDTKEDLYFFMNLHECFYPFNKKDLPVKFEEFYYDDSSKKWNDTQYNIFYKNGDEIEQLWFNTRDLEINDGYLEVYIAEWKVEEYGGFGVVTMRSNGPIITTHILEEGCVPEVTEDVVFATAMIDGKLTVLKENTND